MHGRGENIGTIAQNPAAATRIYESGTFAKRGSVVRVPLVVPALQAVLDVEEADSGEGRG
ncbi:hypothetical protein MMAN_33470 [Mycobacterium mantenii]|uniref:Uncharacterized protein n=1 Tax=Mycobacterium mantenii TaxID=560555 RepID=A0ABM7JUI1_MYCNT|nr:hypothetical protein MMAN_33470 [Mycobacterium mantenii]